MRVDDLSSGPDRRDEHPAGHGRIQQLRLGLGGKEVVQDPLHPLVLRNRLTSVEQHHGVLGPVLVPRGFVAEALLVRPIHKVLGEGAKTGTEQERDRSVPVGTRPHELNVDALQACAARNPLRDGGIQRDVERRGHRSLAHRLLGRHVDVLAAPRAVLAFEQSDQRSASRLGGRIVHRLRQRAARPQWRPVFVAGDGHVHRGGLQGKVGHRPVGLRTVAAERRDRGVDERRIQFCKRVAPKPQRLGFARFEALEHHVGACDQRLHTLDALIGPQIQHHAALAPVVGPMMQRALGVFDIAGEGSQPSGR